MKPNAIREMSTAELNQKVQDYKTELFNLRFQKATGQLENPLQIRAIKKDIARIKTILKERESAQANA